MNKVSTALVTVAAMGLASQASAFVGGTADVTFSWTEAGTEKIFTASGGGGDVGAGGISNSTYFSTLSGNNGAGYINSDFADEAFFLASGACADPTSSAVFRAQYACRTAAPGLDLAPISDEGPGGLASGTLTVTATTMTGVLNIIPTNDEGAGPQLFADVANSIPVTEATGYNIRSADGSPFKNVWYGVSDQLTLNVNLTGTFSDTNWEITGGTVTFNDPGFQCAIADFSGVLCGASQLGDGQGSIRSWGENHASVTDASLLGEIEVWNPAGDTLLEVLGGVLASLSVDGAGNITTTQGEFRRGGEQGGCPGQIRYDSASGLISCGSLATSTLGISGTFTPIPVPAAVWLFGSALGLLGWVRRRSAA